MSKTSQENAQGNPLLTNRMSLTENFNKRPALNAVATAPFTDADATAAANDALVIGHGIANLDFEVLGTNMTTALCTFADGGGITLTTAGADADSGIVTPHLDTNQSAWAAVKWNTIDEIAMSVRIKTGANITDAIIIVGFKLTNTPVVITDANQIFLRYENDINGGKFQWVTSRADTDIVTDTGLEVEVSTSYNIQIWTDAERIPHLVINDVVYAGSDNTALVTDIDLIPFIAVEADGAAAAKALTVRPGFTCSKIDND